MPDPREAADNPVGRDALRPVASPVDTFVRPGGDSGLSQLAESLKGIAPELSRYSDVAAEQQSATQKAAGEQRARELFDSGVSFKDAIAKKLISPSESPWFRLGANEQMGRVTAGKYGSDLAAAVASNEALQGSTDPADFDKFAQNFKKQWTADNNGDQAKGLQFDNSFGKLSEENTKDLRMEFAKDAGKRLVKNAGDNVYAEGFNTLDHELSMNTNRDAIAGGLGLVLARAHAMGIDDRIANMAIVKSIGDIVMRDGDTTLFDIMKKIPAGNQSLYARPWAQEEIQKVTQEVFVRKQDHARADVFAQTQARETAVRTKTSDIVSRLLNSKNPSRENIDDDVKALGKIDGEAADRMRAFQNNIVGYKNTNNTNTIQGTTADIFTKQEGEPGYVDVHTLVNLVNSHEINEQGFTELKSQIDKRDESARTAAHEHNPYTDPQFTHAMSTTRTLIGNEFDFSKPGDQQRIAGATAEFGKYWLEYAASPEFKTATPTDKNEFLVNTQKLVVSKWRTTDTKAETSTTPAIDLSTPRQRQINRTMATQIEFERGNKAYSPNSIAFMRANGLHDDAAITAFINKNRKKLPN